MDCWPPDGDHNDNNNLIEHYFNLGLKQWEILAFLRIHHGLKVSLRTLQRILRLNGLRRRGYMSALVDIVEAIDQEILDDTEKDIGYRSMHQRLIVKYGFTANRDFVRRIMSFLDPTGVQARQCRRLHRRKYRTKGPNYLWHIDGWDKLKQFGLCVHGCIDGYSRRVLWLEVASSNNDPYVVCSYFAKYCKLLGGIPHLVRADRGTENVNIESMQIVMRLLNSDPHGNMEVSFLYGKSTSNQRIEAWWSKFKQLGMNTWIEHFKDLSSAGIIDTSSELDIECVRYCYMDILISELNFIKKLWNLHYIRKSKSCTSPNGKPNVMYFIPEAYNTCDYKHPFLVDDMNYAEQFLTNTIPKCNEIYSELFTILMAEEGKEMPQSLHSASDLLVYLLVTVKHELQRD